MTADIECRKDAAIDVVPQRSSFADRLYALRDRALESQHFQRFCSRFLLTRPIANREARKLFDLCAGFVYSQILAACVQVRLFDALSSGPLSVRELSTRLGLSEPATLRLLRAAAALRLVDRRSGERYGLGMLGAAFNGNPAVAAMVRHHEMLYRDLRDPVALLRGEVRTELSRYWAYAGSESQSDLDSADVAAYSALMASSQSLIADDVIRAYPLEKHRCLLDVGGGEGAFIATAARRFPKLRFQLFDLPPVAKRAQSRFDEDGFSDRADAFGGNFRLDPLPRGADVISLVRVLHDHDDGDANSLLRRVREALPADGVVLVAEPFACAPGAQAMGDAYFGFYLLAMGQGRPRSADEISGLLGAAGFRNVRRWKTDRPLLTGVISACA